MDEVDGTALQLTPREARPTSRIEVRATGRSDDYQPERRACENLSYAAPVFVDIERKVYQVNDAACPVINIRYA